jgi:hypothetical protein
MPAAWLTLAHFGIKLFLARVDELAVRVQRTEL